MVGTVLNITYVNNNYYNISISIFNYKCNFDIMGHLVNMEYVGRIKSNTRFFIIYY